MNRSKSEKTSSSLVPRGQDSQDVNRDSHLGSVVTDFFAYVRAEIEGTLINYDVELLRKQKIDLLKKNHRLQLELDNAQREIGRLEFQLTRESAKTLFDRINITVGFKKI